MSSRAPPVRSMLSRAVTRSLHRAFACAVQGMVQDHDRGSSWPRYGAADPLEILRSVRSDMALSESVFQGRQCSSEAALHSAEQVTVMARALRAS